MIKKQNNKLEFKLRFRKWGFRIDLLGFRGLNSMKNAKLDVLFHFEVGYNPSDNCFPEAGRKELHLSFDILCFNKPSGVGARWGFRKEFNKNGRKLSITTI